MFHLEWTLSHDDNSATELGLAIDDATKGSEIEEERERNVRMKGIAYQKGEKRDKRIPRSKGKEISLIAKKYLGFGNWET